MKPLLLSICALLAACGSDDRVPRPKNLLVIAVDTLRADALGVYGASSERTPHIDSLGAEGVVFLNAVSHASWTLPSFASTLTSTYTSTHGCWTKDARLPESFQTMPEVFQAAGFDTYGIASHIFFNEKYGLQQGFDGFDESLGHPANVEGWEPLTSPKVSERAVRWLEAQKDRKRPWLLWLHYFDPHIPYVDHSRRKGGPEVTDERELYFAEVHYTDKFVGDVLDALDATGFADDTAVLLLSDHGEAFYEHPDVRRHSHSLFQEELRVPLILKSPGLAARRVPGLTRTVDLMPTLLELFGLEAKPGQMIGHSLVPSLLGERQPIEPLLSEIRLKPAPQGKHGRAVMDGRWKLIEELDGTLVLYDHLQDPLEEQDLAAAQPEEVQRLQALMQALEDQAVQHGQAFGGQGKVEHSDEERAELDKLGYSEANDEDS